MKTTIKKLIFKEKINRLDAEILLAHILAKPREFIISHTETQVSFWNIIRFFYVARLCKRGKPIAYITQSKEFFRLNFLVNKHTLIPRPDTEILVETAIKTLDESKTQNNLLIDIGTGSGCIPISIAKNIKKKIKIIVSDISKKALKVAKKNAEKHKIEMSFYHGSLLKPIYKFPLNKYKNILITANLPYLTQEQFNTEKSIQHEPKNALVAKDNGLDIYKKLIIEIKKINLKSNVSVFFEIDPSQAKLLKDYIQEKIKLKKIKIIKDLSGKERLLYFCL